MSKNITQILFVFIVLLTSKQEICKYNYEAGLSLAFPNIDTKSVYHQKAAGMGVRSILGKENPNHF